MSEGFIFWRTNRSLLPSWMSLWGTWHGPGREAGQRLEREAEEEDVQLWPRDKHPRTSCTRPFWQRAEGRASRALGSLGPGSVGRGTQWWEEAWAQGGVLVHWL